MVREQHREDRLIARIELEAGVLSRGSVELLRQRGAAICFGLLKRFGMLQVWSRAGSSRGDVVRSWSGLRVGIGPGEAQASKWPWGGLLGWHAASFSVSLMISSAAVVAGGSDRGVPDGPRNVPLG